MESIEKALLVEDNPGDARLLSEAWREVQPAPFTLTAVDRFTAGIEALKGAALGAVLLDSSLPDGNGLDPKRRSSRNSARSIVRRRACMKASASVWTSSNAVRRYWAAKSSWRANWARERNLP